jgi:hypothetical protein
MPNGVKGPKAFDLEKLSDVELVEMQAHSNDWYVRQSRIILHHRTISGKLNKSSVLGKLQSMLANAKTVGKRLRALVGSSCDRRDYSGARRLPAR